ncbi:MAG: AzlC family ABC transporter permease [Clostridia bacterium]|nr:AzlC family ABC transporter permease [Clostridia bacterium]
MLEKGKNAFLLGAKDGIPIGLGYLAVSFALGIAAKNAGLTALQGFVTSLINAASAGEYAGFRVIADKSPYLIMFAVTLVVNARYFLMSCSLTQKFSPDAKLPQRLAAGFCMTDEIFGISMAQKGFLDYRYTVGAAVVAYPLWAVGTALGIIAGSVLGDNLVTALGVMLYAMFICIVVPPAKEDKRVLAAVLVSMLLSLVCSLAPVVKDIAEGTRTLVLTVIISAAAALIFPREEATENE